MILISFIILLGIIKLFLPEEQNWNTPHPNFFPPAAKPMISIIEKEEDHLARIEKYGFSWATVRPINFETQMSLWIDPPDGYCWHGCWQSDYPYYKRKLLPYGG